MFDISLEIEAESRETRQDKFTLRLVVRRSFCAAPELVEVVWRVFSRLAYGDCLICKTQVVGFAPHSFAGPSFQSRPILRFSVRVCHSNSGWRRIQFLCRKLLYPLNNLLGKFISIHPFYE